MHFQRLDSNIPTTPAYDVYISQLIHVHYALACSLYLFFSQRHCLLRTKLDIDVLLQSLGRYLRWGTISPRGSHPPKLSVLPR
jgi:hypothetical protein